MSGILNNKTRIMEVPMSLEGRRQLSLGKMRIEHISFTDASTYYAADLVSGSADATARIYLECSNLPQDQITFEADDSGRLQSFNSDQNIQLKDGRILDYSFTAATSSFIAGSFDTVTTLTGSEFASTSELLLPQSLENFKKLRIIATRDSLFEDDGFDVSSSNVEFTIHDKKPIADTSLQIANIDNVDSIFSDPRFDRMLNFKYLPPINRTRDTQYAKTSNSDMSSRILGNYPPWGRQTQLTYDNIKSELDFYGNQGYVKTIRFDPTSSGNNLVGQFFEQGRDYLKKLDVIDYGSFRTQDSSQPIVKIFFVGKMLVDSKDSNTFVHMFTLMFG